MIRAAGSALLLLPLAFAGCSSFSAEAFEQPVIPNVCEEQVYADPAVKDLIMKGLGTGAFRLTHVNQLNAAKQDAARRCMQQKGLAPPGAVERPRVQG